jgi:hypothetical protein
LHPELARGAAIPPAVLLFAARWSEGPMLVPTTLAFELVAKREEKGLAVGGPRN